MYRRLQPLPGPWCRRERCTVPPPSSAPAILVTPAICTYRNKRTIGRNTKPPLDLPGAKWTGVTLRVKGRPGDDVLVVDVVVV